MSTKVDNRSDLKLERRAARAASNRADILDAAERTFAAKGVDGSLREIANESGYSTAAIYNYFENKDHLYAETLSRRGVELLTQLNDAASTPGDPMRRLHAIADAAVRYFASQPDFQRMLRHVRTADSAIPLIVAQYASDRIDGFAEIVEVMLGIVKRGQRSGDVRRGSPSALLHFFMTIVYEHVFLAADQPDESLTEQEFHGLLDGTLRRPR